MIFKRGLDEDNSAPVFVVNYISESRSWSRPGMEGIEYSAPLYVDKSSTDLLRNNGIVFERSVTEDTLIVDSAPEHAILGTAGFAGQFAPLFILIPKDSRFANFDFEKIKELFSDVEQPDEKSKRVYPEDILDYIYASLHSPSYRSKYKEFLKTDFPRVPRPASWKEFWRLAVLGGQLRELHLMTSLKVNNLITTYPSIGNNLVEKIKYKDNKVWINAEQCFEKVPELAWNFYIGGYQPAQKYLKDRKDRELTDDEIRHWQKIIVVLVETDKVMREIG